MAEHTSTREGFQRAMKETLTGKPEDAHVFADSACTPTFYQIFNGEKLERGKYIASLATWRGKITDYDPVVHEFLRDGDQLAARMDGVIKLDGAATYFECFLFAKVDPTTGKMEYLVDRSIWGPPGQAPTDGATL